MRTDRITANLPSRDFAATEAFYARLGFDCTYRSGEWMILERGPLEVEFFPWPDLDPYASAASACVRVDDLDALHAAWSSLGLSRDPRQIPRLTAIEKRPDVPRMFALLDGDGSLLRVLQNGDD